MSSTSPAWFRQHFNEDYRTLYAGRSQEQADAEVAFVVERLGIRPSDRVLDLCCGYGRHLRSFQGLGVPVVGVDLSDVLLRQAPAGPGIELVCADMRRLPFEPRFTVLVNFFTSFGYFDSDDENVDAAREMARVLVPEGRFLIDLMNPSAVVAGLVPRTERRAGHLDVVETRSFDAQRRRIEKRIEVFDTRTSERRLYNESVRVYEEAEARALLEDVGLEVEQTFGDFSGAPTGPDQPRLAMLGRRL